MKKFIAFMLLFVCAFVFFGCNKNNGSDDVMPTAIKINETSVTVKVGGSTKLTATIEPENVSSKLVDWTSDNDAVATVSGTGTVKGVAAGTAKITVTCKADSKISASINVTVTADKEEVALEKIEIVGASQVVIGADITLTINATPANASKEVEWASSNESILTVDANGKVTGVAEGTAKVTATSKEDATKVAEKEISVVAGEVGALESISISATQSYVIEGDTIKLTAVASPEGADNSVTWTSSDESVATIDDEGNVTALEGCTSTDVTFTATSTVDPSKTATRKISVVALIDVVYTISLAISNVPAGNKLALNKTLQLGHTSTGPVDEATGQNKKVTNTSVLWESSNEAVATVEDGLVTPVATGEVTITITAADGSLDGTGEPLKKSVTLNIYAPKTPTTWTVEPSRDISNGFEYGKDLTIKVTVGDEEDATATFTSSDDTIATIDENGKITSTGEGEVTFTATSVADPSKSGTVKVNFVKEIIISNTPTSVSVTGESEMYVGYSITLTATVLPLTAIQTITWSSSDESVATVDQNGRVTALAEGTIRIKVVSTADKKIYTNFKIVITVEPPKEPIPNLGGYEIIIMNAESALTDNDPFLEGYNGADKTFKQQAWREVEEAYNCKIKVVAYPDSAPWGNARIEWIKDNAAANTSQCDLGIISSNWIYKFAQSDAAIDVTKFYNKYGAKQMEPAQKQAGTYKNKLYTASTGTSQTATSVDMGLFYNVGWLEQLGLEDPATMFNEGRWNYSGFEEWVMSAQAKIGEEKKALGGHPYYFYYGMTNAAGVKIADSVLVKTNISSQASKNAGALIWKLTEAGCVNTTATWAESAGEHDFLTGDVLMTTGFLWFVRTSNRWKKDMWGDDTRYGYVPFPYPDDVAKENTRIGVSGLSVYLYVNGRPYPAGVTAEYVYRAMNDMFLNTIKYQEADDNFDPQAIKYNSLKSRIDNEASIEAIMYYDSSKVFYDPAHSIYDSIAATVLKAPAVYVMYQGQDWDEVFDAVAESYESLFKQIYS